MLKIKKNTCISADILISLILVLANQNLPLWRNWQTHLTQNQAVNSRAGSSPASGIRAVAYIICSSFFFTRTYISANKINPLD